MKFRWTLPFAVAALSGCSQLAYVEHGEWLDRISVRPAHPVEHTVAEQQALLADRTRLRGQAEELRQRMASEKSRDQRMRYLRELRDVDDDLRAVDYALQGGPLPGRRWPSFL
jgi:hypothetical protein